MADAEFLAVAAADLDRLLATVERWAGLHRPAAAGEDLVDTDPAGPAPAPDDATPEDVAGPPQAVPPPAAASPAVPSPAGVPAGLAGAPAAAPAASGRGAVHWRGRLPSLRRPGGHAADHAAPIQPAPPAGTAHQPLRPAVPPTMTRTAPAHAPVPAPPIRGGASLSAPAATPMPALPDRTPPRSGEPAAHPARPPDLAPAPPVQLPPGPAALGPFAGVAPRTVTAPRWQGGGEPAAAGDHAPPASPASPASFEPPAWPDPAILATPTAFTPAAQAAPTADDLEERLADMLEAAATEAGIDLS